MDIRSQKSRTALFTAASAMMANGQDPTLADIAAEAGIGRATLHRHFASRDVFINALAAWALESLEKAALRAARLATTHEQAFFAIVKALIPLGDRYHILTQLRIISTNPEILARIRAQNKDMEELVTRLQEQGIFSRAFNADWINGVLDALIYTAWQKVQSGDLAANSAYGLVTKTLKSGFGTKED